MRRCVILLDGAEKPEAMRRELGKDDVLVAVDRAVDTCMALDRAPAVAVLGDGTASEKATDWAAFSGVPREEYRPRDGTSGLEVALEWALTSGDVTAVDIVNAFGRGPAEDAARLLAFANLRTDTPVAILTAGQRITVLSGGYTLNGKQGLEFSLVPLDAGSAITVKNGKHDLVHRSLAPGSAVLLRQKLASPTANLLVTSGRFLVYLPR